MSLVPDSYFARIAAAETAAELDLLEHELFGRKSGAVTAAMRELAGLPPLELKERGRALNEMKRKLTEAITIRRRVLARTSASTLATSDPLDVTLSLPRRERGHLHLIPEFIRTVEEVFGRMGFAVAEGPEVETEELNFTLLNMPEDHPARDTQATFWVKNRKRNTGNQRLVLRTQTSPVQIRYMRSHKPPFRVICPGKVYRKDADATHSPMFHQFEGLMVGEDVSLANMKAVMIAAIRELIAPNAEFRFRTSFFPFVEPGLEVDIRWQGETGSREGEPVPAELRRSGGGWLEIVGCGMVHPTVLRNCGVDPRRWRGFAFGFGVERMIMLKHGIPDLRSLYEGDLRFLRQF